MKVILTHVKGSPIVIITRDGKVLSPPLQRGRTFKEAFELMAERRVKEQ